MSKTNKKDVGKGIRALLSNIEKSDSGNKGKENVAELGNIKPNKLPINQIEPNPFQPRHDFDREELDDLISSVRVHGIIQPIAVRKLNKKSFQIISGERRWRAAKELGLDFAPVHILEADDQAMLEIALLENIQRSDLNPIEISISYQRLIDECKLTHEELSERLGKKRSSISNYLRLLKLSPSAQQALQNKNISLGHAKVLAGIDRTELQTFVLGKIIQEDLSVRATESAIKKLENSSTLKKTESKAQNTEVVNIQNEITEFLGSKTIISRSKDGRGNIKISFGSDDELNDIIDSILD